LEKNRLKKLRRKERKRIDDEVGLVEQPGVVYIGHIPHGFYEAQMKDFFSQFGTVNKLCHVRSRKTGYSRGFAFVEFEFEEVAKIVADTMNNYLMFNKLLKCEFVPHEKVKSSWFLQHNHEFRKEMKKLSKKQVNVIRTGDEMSALNHKRYTRLSKAEEKLRAAGVSYKYPGEIPEKIKKFKPTTRNFTMQAKKMLKADAKAKINQKLSNPTASGKVSKFPLLLRRRLSDSRRKDALQLARRRILAKKYGLTPKLKKKIQEGNIRVHHKIKTKVKPKFTVTEKK